MEEKMFALKCISGKTRACFFFNGKPGHRGTTHPLLMENSIKGGWVDPR